MIVRADVQTPPMSHSQPDCNSASARCTTDLTIMSEVGNDPNPKSEGNVRLRVKAEVDNQTILEATKESIMDVANSMTQEQKSSMRAMGQGSISVIAGKLSEIVPKKYESVPFEYDTISPALITCCASALILKIRQCSSCPWYPW